MVAKRIGMAALWMPKYGTDHINTESYIWRKSEVEILYFRCH